MSDAAARAAVFILALLGTPTFLAIGWRVLRNHQRARALACANIVSLSEAARIACRQAVAERLSVADGAAQDRSPGGNVAWFERSIRQVVPSRGAGHERVTRAELKRYMDWARSVQ